MPASTRAARCRLSVAGAMPCARWQSFSFEGKTINGSPAVSVVSWWKDRSAESTAIALSGRLSLSLASVIAWKTFHLWTVFSGLTALACCCVAIKPSDNPRRPKGVVTNPCVIISAFNQAKEFRPPKWQFPKRDS